MDKQNKIDCKYGANCYQKNSIHLQKYKHPQKVEQNKTKRSPSPDHIQVQDDAKRQKTSPSPGRSPVKEKINEGNTTPKPDLPDSSTDSQTKIEDKSPNKLDIDEDSSKSESPKSGTKESTEPHSSTTSEGRKEMDITKEYNEVMHNLSNTNYLELFQKRVRYSQKAEYQDLLKTPEGFIRDKFLVDMPSDFYKFWDFCKLNTKEGKESQDILEKFGLKLVGPFDYLAGNFHDAKIGEPGDYTRHWRFFYDPPEFQTVLVKSNTGIHYGYWRDDPKEKTDLLMARNDASQGCEFEFVGGNCFETVLYFLEKDFTVTPFNKAAAIALKKFITTFASSNGITLDSLENLKKKRSKNVVCPTFHKAGLVVPYDRKLDTGYRNLIISDASLKKMLEKFEKAKGDKEKITVAMGELQSIITAAMIAVDESDFGTSIELGIDLFCSGITELHSVLSPLLITGYSMVQRPQFIAIMKTHLEFRRKDFNLSIFD